jgi:hypothetical protein
MGRPRKWSSDAERKAAQRRGDPELDPAEDPLTPGEREFLEANVQKGTENLKVRVPDNVDIAPVRSGLPPLRKPENPPDLEEYVADAVEAARIVASARYSDEAWVESAVSSAERYARWRHAGYVAGEIVSL